MNIHTTFTSLIRGCVSPEVKENTGLSACLLGCVYLSAAEGAEPPALQAPRVLLQHRQQVAPSEVQLVRRLCFVVVHGAGDAVLKGRKLCLSSLLCASFVLYLVTSPAACCPVTCRLSVCLGLLPRGVFCLFVFFVYLCLSICICFYLFIFLSISVHLFLLIHLLSINLYFYLVIYLSIHLSREVDQAWTGQ